MPAVDPSIVLAATEIVKPGEDWDSERAATCFKRAHLDGLPAG